jgi:hypothetical protein
MADNKLEVVIEVDVAKGNASIKTLDASLSSIEEAASKAGRGASAGIDSITVSLAKGPQLFRDIDARHFMRPL